jgi:hypothetical protein
MTGLAADERAERIIRSLKENSAEFVQRDRAQRMAPVRIFIQNCLVFAAGVAVGALIVTALAAN